jgi:hypothetical protein
MSLAPVSIVTRPGWPSIMSQIGAAAASAGAAVSSVTAKAGAAAASVKSIGAVQKANYV